MKAIIWRYSAGLEWSITRENTPQMRLILAVISQTYSHATWMDRVYTRERSEIKPLVENIHLKAASQFDTLLAIPYFLLFFQPSAYIFQQCLINGLETTTNDGIARK